MHYLRWRRHGDVGEVLPQRQHQHPDTCSVVENGEPCGRPHVARGYCNLHVQRWRKHGDPLWIAPDTSEQRFWAGIGMGPLMPNLEKTPCWLWTGATIKGYGQFHFDGGRYVHRFSFARTFPMFWPGFLEQFQIDHRCHNKACVRPDHLRPVTNKQNQENYSGPQRNSRSGVRGVWWDKHHQKWCAKVVHNGKNNNVGYFTDLAEAEAAVIAKRNELHTYNDLDRVSS
ncbi:HNH endonuclease [Mycobacterium paraense]